jgi:hypothetical protein
LTMGRSGAECCRNGHEQLGSLEIVGRRERGLRKARTAGRAAEARKGAAVGLTGVAAGRGVAESTRGFEAMLGAAMAGAVRWAERTGRDSFDAVSWPVHAAKLGKARAAPKRVEE